MIPYITLTAAVWLILYLSPILRAAHGTERMAELVALAAVIAGIPFLIASAAQAVKRRE